MTMKATEASHSCGMNINELNMDAVLRVSTDAAIAGGATAPRPQIAAVVTPVVAAAVTEVMRQASEYHRGELLSVVDMMESICSLPDTQECE